MRVDEAKDACQGRNWKANGLDGKRRKVEGAPFDKRRANSITVPFIA